MNAEKTSQTSQWQERSSQPVIARVMTEDDVENFRRHLASSYQCDISDILSGYRKIDNINDDDRYDFLLLVYQLRCIDRGSLIKRDIYSIKVPVLESVRTAARERQKLLDEQKLLDRYTRIGKVSPAGRGAALLTIQSGESAHSVPPPRPALKKPVRR